MSIEIYYPASGATIDTVTLRNPDYGDSENYDTNTFFHIGSSGTVFSYKKKLRRIILLNFTSLSKAKIAEFEAFYIAHAGSLLGYDDVNDCNWTMRLMNNPLETITTSGAGSCELNNMTLQFSATMIVVTGNKLVDAIGGNTLVDDEGNVLAYA